jgi:hypothetical protein
MGGDLPFLYRFFVLLLEYGSSIPVEHEASGRGGLVSDLHTRKIKKFKTHPDNSCGAIRFQLWEIFVNEKASPLLRSGGIK